MQLHGQGVAAGEIAHRFEISRASVYRVLDDARAKPERESKGRSRASVCRVNTALTHFPERAQFTTVPPPIANRILAISFLSGCIEG
jgi:hypothetical protein